VASPYEIAKQHGYSDEEIDAYLSKKDQKYQQALDAGYTRDEIDTFLSKKREPKESLGANIGRQVGRGAARVTETVLGAPRAFGEFMEGLVPEKALKKGASKIGLEKPVTAALEFQKKHAPYKLFPKSEDIRENVTKKLFGEKLEPKNEWEAKADEFISDFAALALPLPGSKFKLLKPGLLAAGGNIASDVVGRMGGSEKEQTWAKLGTILAGSLINPKAAQNLKNELYDKARSARPQDAKVAATDLSKRADKLEKSFKIGGIADSDIPALEKLKDIKNEIKGSDIDIVSLENLKIKINEALAGIYKKLEGNKPGIRRAKRNLDAVGKLVDDTLKTYGKKNPEWEAFYRPANEVHGAIEQSHRVRNTIVRNAKKFGFPAVAAELGLIHFAGVPAAVGTVAVGAAALGTGELTARIMKSPTLRKHYINLINAALKDDAVVMRENLKKLDEELKKEKG
jgi:hypothetical protein